MVANYTTQKILIDNRSLVNIFYWPAFLPMKFGKKKIQSVTLSVVGFVGEKLYPIWAITLPITARTTPQSTLMMVDFFIVNCPSADNAIIGRTTLNKMRDVTSTYHLKMKLPKEA